MMTLTVLVQNSEKENIEKVVSLSSDRKWCAQNAFFTLDGISFFPAYDISGSPFVFAVNSSRTSNKIIYRVNDEKVIKSSMSEYSYKKFKAGLMKNGNRLLKETNEVLLNA